MLDVVAALLVPLDERAPRLREARFVIGREQHRRVSGQVIEQRCGPFEEQRQVVLDARRCEAFADVAVQRHARQVALEARAEAPAEILDCFRCKREFARRQQVQPLEPGRRPLRLGVEAADAVDDVVEEVDAQRCVGPHREDVEQRAANREVARLAHLRHARVTRTGEAQPELLEVEGFVDLEAQRVAVDERARRQSLQRRGQVHEHDAALECRHPGEGPQALRDDVRVRRELVIGQGLVAGERIDAEFPGGEEAEFFLETRGGGGVPGDDQQGPLGRFGGARDRQRRGGAGQADPAQARSVRGGQGRDEVGHALGEEPGPGKPMDGTPRRVAPEIAGRILEWKSGNR